MSHEFHAKFSNSARLALKARAERLGTVAQISQEHPGLLDSTLPAQLPLSRVLEHRPTALNVSTVQVRVPLPPRPAQTPVQNPIQPYEAPNPATLILLSSDSKAIYLLLHRLLSEAVQARGGNPRKATHALGVLPAELVFTELGIPQRTYYRRVKDLHALGLLVTRGHKTTLLRDGKEITVNDGTLYKLLLKPEQARADQRQKIMLEEFKADYGRDLAQDIQARRTAWSILGGNMTGQGVPVRAVLEQVTPAALKSGQPGLKLEPEPEEKASPRKRGRVDLELAESLPGKEIGRGLYPVLLAFALGKTPEIEDVKSDSATPGRARAGHPTDGKQAVLERIYTLELLTEDSGRVGTERVAEAARTFGQIFGDDSFKFWCWLLQRAKALHWQGVNRFSYLKALLNRAFVGQQARELLNPAAWMVSELKKSGLWDELASAKLMS